MKDKYKILVNQLIDDELNDKEKSKINDIIRTEPEVAVYYNEMLELERSLKIEKDYEEIDLSKEIFDKIDEKKYKIGRKYNSSDKSLLHNYNFRYGVSFAFGVATVLIFVLLIPFTSSNNELNEKELLGMITDVESLDFPQIQKEHHIEQQDLDISIKFYEHKDITLAYLKAQLDNSVKIELENINNNFEFKGFQKLSNNSNQKVELYDNKIVIETNAGNNYIVKLKIIDNNYLIKLKLIKNNVLIYENELNTK